MTNEVNRLDQLKPETEREQMLLELGQTTATVDALRHAVKTLRDYGDHNSPDAIAQVLEKMAGQADRGQLLDPGSPLKPLIEKAAAEHDAAGS